MLGRFRQVIKHKINSLVTPRINRLKCIFSNPYQSQRHFKAITNTSLFRSFHNHQSRSFCSYSTPHSTKQRSLHRILLTGGPCAGKTTALSTIQQFLINSGYIVYSIPEASTLLQLSGGIVLNKDVLPYFQPMCTKTQLHMEDVFYYYALSIQKHSLVGGDVKPIVILMDRGVLDGKAYVTEDSDFSTVLQFANYPPDLNQSYIKRKLYRKENNIHNLMTHPGNILRSSLLSEMINNRYDLILHLETAAKGASKFYETTSYRKETKAEAIVLDDRLLSIYGGHHSRIVFENKGSFDDKMENVVGYVASCLGIPNLRSKILRLNVELDSGIGADLDKLVDRIRKEVVAEKGRVMGTHVVKHFLKRNKVFKHGYSFIRKVNELDIEKGSVLKQIAKIHSDSQRFYINAGDGMSSGDLVNIPSVFGSMWDKTTLYMLIECNEVYGESVSRSETLHRLTYINYKVHQTDPKRKPIEKVKLFFQFRGQSYALDVFLKENAEGFEISNTILKVYRGEDEKYKDRSSAENNLDLDVPKCFKIVKNVTLDPEYTSFAFSGDNGGK